MSTDPKKRKPGSKVLRFVVTGALVAAPATLGACGEENHPEPNLPVEQPTINEPPNPTPPEEMPTVNAVPTEQTDEPEGSDSAEVPEAEETEPAPE